jgi:hypothetical protein
MPNSRVLVCLLAAGALAPAALRAQVRASEPAVVAQTVDGTTITVDYSRPRLRDRRQIWGKVVTWGEVWTPGANWATTLEADKDITVNGHKLGKGKYSVWMQVGQKEWTVIFDPKWKLFHLDPPKPDSTQLRFTVVPDKVDGPDVLTWSVPAMTPTGMTLEMAWAGKRVSLAIVVPPSFPLTTAADIAGRYTGAYTFSWVPEDTSKAAADTSASNKPSTWSVTYTTGMLMVDWVPPPFEEWSHLVLIKYADNAFRPGSMVKGELFDVETYLSIEFTVENGRATGFDVRSEEDKVIGRGVRKD